MSSSSVVMSRIRDTMPSIALWLSMYRLVKAFSILRWFRMTVITKELPSKPTTPINKYITFITVSAVIRAGSEDPSFSSFVKLMDASVLRTFSEESVIFVMLVLEVFVLYLYCTDIYGHLMHRYTH